jgi:hypothetical protein
MSSRTGKDMNRAILYNIDVTKKPQRLSETSYPKCRLTLIHSTVNRRVAISYGDELKIGGSGFEFPKNVPHVICEDPSMLYIASDNEVVVSVQIERDWR